MLYLYKKTASVVRRLLLFMKSPFINGLRKMVKIKSGRDFLDIVQNLTFSPTSKPCDFARTPHK